MFLICLISSFSLDFVHIISARCTKVDIRFVFCLVGLKDSQRKYCPVKVGFLYTLVSKPVAVRSTLTSRNGKQLFLSFSKVNLREVSIKSKQQLILFKDDKLKSIAFRTGNDAGSENTS